MVYIFSLSACLAPLLSLGPWFLNNCWEYMIICPWFPSGLTQKFPSETKSWQKWQNNFHILSQTHSMDVLCMTSSTYHGPLLRSEQNFSHITITLTLCPKVTCGCPLIKGITLSLCWVLWTVKCTWKACLRKMQFKCHWI